MSYMHISKGKIPNFVIKPNGKSFLECPKCKGNLYNPCLCEPKNYTCKSCDWSYFNHDHTNISQINSKNLVQPGSLHTFKMPK